MIQMVIPAKYSPCVCLIVYLTIIPLMFLKFCEFVNRCLVNDKSLVSVSLWRFVFMRIDMLNQKRVISKWGFSSEAVSLFLGDTICAKNEPLLVPTSYIMFLGSQSLIKKRASCWCRSPLLYRFMIKQGIPDRFIRYDLMSIKALLFQWNLIRRLSLLWINQISIDLSGGDILMR